jgi:hypothetical protein
MRACKHHTQLTTTTKRQYETDRVPEEFARRCNAMDEVWVPSRWQVGTFVASGVNATKIRVVPEVRARAHVRCVFLQRRDEGL